jgi:hypothetical protein
MIFLKEDNISEVVEHCKNDVHGVIGSEGWQTVYEIADKCWMLKTTYVKIYPVI